MDTVSSSSTSDLSQSAQADFAAERSEAFSRGFNRPLPLPHRIVPSPPATPVNLTATPPRRPPPLLRPDITTEHATVVYLSLTRSEVYDEFVGVFHWTPRRLRTLARRNPLATTASPPLARQLTSNTLDRQENMFYNVVG